MCVRVSEKREKEEGKNKILVREQKLGNVTKMIKNGGNISKKKKNMYFNIIKYIEVLFRIAVKI